MPETNEKKLEVKFVKNLTEELRKEPKIITKTQMVSVANSMMENAVNSDNRVGFIIYGYSGVGKTAAIEYFAQANDSKGVNIQVIQIESSVLKSISDDNMKQKIELFLAENKDKKVCIYIKLNSESFKKVMEYLDEWSEKNDNKFTCKFFIELNAEDSFFEKEKLTELWKNFYMCYSNWPFQSLSDILKAFKPRIDEISKKYGISYKLKDLECLVVGLPSIPCDFKSYEALISEAFQICKNSGETKFKKSVWKKMFPDLYSDLESFSKKNLKRTAYHESGHALMGLVAPDYCIVTSVDIIPKPTSKGVTKSIDHFFCDNMDVSTWKVMKSLAGRLTEVIVFEMQYNSGAISDLEKSNSSLIKLFDRMAVSNNIGENMIFSKKELEDGLISENTKRAREKEKIRLLKKAKKQAIKIILEHREFLDILAKRLMKKKYVTETEINKMWKKYLKGKKNKKK